jgi:hypothetical protein
VAGACALAILLLPPFFGAARAAMAAHRARADRLAALCALAALGGFLVTAALELSFIRRWVPLVMFGVLGIAIRAAKSAAHTRNGSASTG